MQHRKRKRKRQRVDLAIALVDGQVALQFTGPGAAISASLCPHLARSLAWQLWESAKDAERIARETASAGSNELYEEIGGESG